MAGIAHPTNRRNASCRAAYGSHIEADARRDVGIQCPVAENSTAVWREPLALPIGRAVSEKEDLASFVGVLT